jgi:hypothetical protein
MSLACPCGQDHTSSPAWKAVQGFAERLGVNVGIQVSGKTWQVPRVWIAFHGLVAADLPRLAAEHGWAGPGTPAAGGSR